MSKSKSLQTITSFKSSPMANGYEAHVIEVSSSISDKNVTLNEAGDACNEKNKKKCYENELDMIKKELETMKIKKDKHEIGKNETEFNEEIVPIDANAENVEIIKQKLTSMGDLRFLKKVKKINFRWNLIKKIDGLNHIGNTLVELILVDNQITKLENVDNLINLKILNVSYNRLTCIENLENLKNLEKLFLVHNKITKIQNLENLTNLRYLELGDNRIQKIENLETLKKLEELHLGANQIRKIENLDELSETLHTLTLLGNCITKIEGLSKLENLKILSIAQNGLRTIENLDSLKKLEILDLNDNIIEQLGGLKHLQSVTRLWLRKIKNLSYLSIKKELKLLPNLKHLVFEGTSLSKEPKYRDKIIKILPNLDQLDSYPVWWIPGDPYQLRPEGKIFY